MSKSTFVLIDFNIIISYKTDVFSAISVYFVFLISFLHLKLFFLIASFLFPNKGCSNLFTWHWECKCHDIMCTVHHDAYRRNCWLWHDAFAIRLCFIGGVHCSSESTGQGEDWRLESPDRGEAWAKVSYETNMHDDRSLLNSSALCLFCILFYFLCLSVGW